MGGEVKAKDKEPARVKDVTKPWRSKFFPCKDKGPEPEFNRAGFWKKPEHGLPVNKGA